MRKMIKLVMLFFLIGVAIATWWGYTTIHTKQVREGNEPISFTVQEGENVRQLAERLSAEDIIANAWLFRKYVVFKGIDRKVHAGNFVVQAPVTIASVAEALKQTALKTERTITLIPGWDLRDIAAYFAKEGIATEDEFYRAVGKPAVDYRTVSGQAPVLDGNWQITKDKPPFVSYEGYFAPDTFRVYADATLEEIIDKLITHRDQQFTDEMYAAIEDAGRSVFEVMTVASLLEREVQSDTDKALVSDIFWRRYDLNWALQADSTVHYATGKEGDVFTSAEDREIDSYWNTYEYPGLPLGPISNPSLESIMAAIYPEKNDYWFFLTTLDTGEVKYASTLEQHNRNVANYLR